MVAARRAAVATVTTDPALELGERKAKALRVHARLLAEYGPFPFFRTLDPLSELVGSLLSHRTKNADSQRAYQRLRARFPTWEAVRDAPVGEVEAALSDCTWPEQKAPRIQAILQELSALLQPPWDLSFLGTMPVPEARAWLESLHGVGPKTSAAVLLFSTLRMAAMPVDSHHHRVAQRLGLIGPKVAEGPAHALLRELLPADWAAQALYDHHEALMFHGQKCCFFAAPACGRCVVRDECPYGQALLKKTRAP